ncbi:MAG: hypothetical protein GF329_16740 [Candidatus Lokiarchaeota archaeon]|nr:hypothetical protein [Candidatus Lokiarchaeota archaeon]
MHDKNLVGSYRILIWGGALIQLVFGLAHFLIIDFLIGEPMLLLYPIINDNLILLIQIFGWIHIISSIILTILGILAGILASKEAKKELHITRIIVIILSIVILIIFPIGTLIGITLLRESWMLNPLDKSE